MPIIKGSHAEASGPAQAAREIAFNFDDMSTRADEYLTQVRGEAAKILRDTQQQAQQVRKQAEQAGQQAAQRTAEQQIDAKVAAQLETLLPALTKVAEELHHARQAWLVHWDRSVVRLATAIAERVIRRELTRQPEITLDLVREALQLAAGSADVALHLHPSDAEFVRPHLRLLDGALRPTAAVQIVADPAISPGGCRVETRFGSIDQQIESQLRRIEEELT